MSYRFIAAVVTAVLALAVAASPAGAQSLPAEAGRYGDQSLPAEAGRYGDQRLPAEAGGYGGRQDRGTTQAGIYRAKKVRRQFITVSYDWLYTQPLHFADHPLADLVGKPVTAAQFEAFDYTTTDGAVLIDVLEFSRRTRGAGVTIYPFGASVGPTVALRASFEDLPNIQIAFSGAGAPGNYSLIGARAYDVAAHIYVADHSRGWGLGSHAFIGGGIGRIKSDVRDGDRYFGEGGGGLSSGPIGIELSVKVAWNHLDDPVSHRFLTTPVTLRGTVSF